MSFANTQTSTVIAFLCSLIADNERDDHILDYYVSANLMKIIFQQSIIWVANFFNALSFHSTHTHLDVNSSHL
jgi:hypothetical protein